MASNHYRLTFSGELVKNGRPIACPTCHTTSGLAIVGRPGDNGALQHCNTTFKFPPDWDARQALLDAIGIAGRQGVLRHPH